MAKANKWLYGWKLYVNYGHGDGFEYEVFELTYKEIRKRAEEYRANCPYPVRVRQGREPNPDYQAKQ